MRTRTTRFDCALLARCLEAKRAHHTNPAVSADADADLALEAALEALESRLPTGTPLPLTVAVPPDDVPGDRPVIIVRDPKDPSDAIWVDTEAAFLLAAADPEFAIRARHAYRTFDRANRMLMDDPELATATADGDAAHDAMMSYPARHVGAVAYKMRGFMGTVEGFDELADRQKHAARCIYADLERLSGYPEQAAAYNRRIAAAERTGGAAQHEITAYLVDRLAGEDLAPAAPSGADAVAQLRRLMATRDAEAAGEALVRAEAPIVDLPISSPAALLGKIAMLARIVTDRIESDGKSAVDRLAFQLELWAGRAIKQLLEGARSSELELATHLVDRLSGEDLAPAAAAERSGRAAIDERCFHPKFLELARECRRAAARLSRSTPVEASPLLELIPAFYRAERAYNDAYERLCALEAGDPADLEAIRCARGRHAQLEACRLAQLERVIATPATDLQSFALKVIVAADLQNVFEMDAETSADARLLRAVTAEAQHFAGVVDLKALRCVGDEADAPAGEGAAPPAARVGHGDEGILADGCEVDRIRHSVVPAIAAGDEEARSAELERACTLETRAATMPARSLVGAAAQLRYVVDPDSNNDLEEDAERAVTSALLAVQRAIGSAPGMLPWLGGDALARLAAKLSAPVPLGDDGAILDAEQEIAQLLEGDFAAAEARVDREGEKGEAWEIRQALMDRINQLADVIRTTPAQTLAGAAAQLRVNRHEWLGTPCGHHPDHPVAYASALAAIERAIGRPAHAIPVVPIAAKDALEAAE